MFFLFNCKLYKIKILEVIEILVQFHCLSSYRNDTVGLPHIAVCLQYLILKLEGCFLSMSAEEMESCHLPRGGRKYSKNLAGQVLTYMVINANLGYLGS